MKKCWLSVFTSVNSETMVVLKRTGEEGGINIPPYSIR